VERQSVSGEAAGRDSGRAEVAGHCGRFQRPQRHSAERPQIQRQRVLQHGAGLLSPRHADGGCGSGQGHPLSERQQREAEGQRRGFRPLPRHQSEGGAAGSHHCDDEAGADPRPGAVLRPGGQTAGSGGGSGHVCQPRMAVPQGSGKQL